METVRRSTVPRRLQRGPLRHLVVSCLLHWLVTSPVTAQLCDTETGQMNLILDMEESQGLQMNQTTRPSHLPIQGLVDDEISLQIASSTRPVFRLEGKQLLLTDPLDRDNEDISSVILQVSCTIRASGKRRNIPVIVRISDVNDNAPVFIGQPYNATIPEDLPVGGVVFRRDALAKDADAGINALVEYRVVPNAQVVGRPANSSLASYGDGYGTFEFKLAHQPVLTLVKPVDYETISRYLVTIVASDRAFQAKDRLSSTATLMVQVTDTDDQGPVFHYARCPRNNGGLCIPPTYSAVIPDGVLTGLLPIQPDRIQAVDMDSNPAPIRYSFDNGRPSNFGEYFEIHPNSGLVRQIRPVRRTEIDQFDLVIRAEELTDAKRFATASLNIVVQAVDLHKPRIEAESLEGLVEENSPIGTVVTSLRRRGQPLQFAVIDDDLEPNDVTSAFNIELTSSAFRVNQQGILEVANANLDRDPPNPGILTFQAIARERDGTLVSAPVSVSVRLTDVNDNSPKFLSHKPVLLPAGDSKRIVTQVQAVDNDWADNGRVQYSLVNASPNSGRAKFIIDPSTGVIDAVGAVSPGEKYALNLEATDGGGRSSQGSVEIIVVPGPNLRPPTFSKESYEVSVNEASPIGTSVTDMKAVDPENEAVAYSIVSGNEQGHFQIGASTGLVSVAGDIDREQLSRYTLTIKAEDQGGLTNTARLMIRVSDTNDRNPEFTDLPYVFRVKENDLTGYIGRVHAKDADTEQNGQVSYSIPFDSPFIINTQTGEIRSRSPLDYETDQVHRIVVTARDGGSEPRLATATVTVLVVDIPDENPKFTQPKYEANVPENHVDYVVVQVQAQDKDTQPSITYTIRQGDTDKFQIDSKTGVIRTKRPLDYERQQQYILVIGTVENTDLNDGQGTTAVVVNVQDRNDMAPVFTSVPRPLRLPSNVQVGHTVATVIAVDSDGSSPNNRLRYEVIGAGKAVQFFRVDPETGIVQTKDDLRKDMDREYKVEIRAYDLGKPPLSAVATVTVFVDHVVAALPPDSSVMSFSDLSYAVSIAEDALVHTLIKNLSIVNKPAEVVPVSCEIVGGNDNDVFYIKETMERNCELRLKRGLDYETTQSYSVHVQLKTLFSAMMDKDKSTARVDVTVIDVNDNSPKFVFKYPENRFTNEKYYAAIPVEAPISSVVLQVQAKDADSGPLGQLLYEIVDETNTGHYLTIERTTGTLRTDKMIDLAQMAPILPLRMTVKARDNPGQMKGYRETNCQVIINVVDQQHRLVVVIPRSTPDQVHRFQSSILGILQDETRLIIQAEKLKARQYVAPNGTVLSDSSGSEFWFYCIDPATDRILSNTHQRINSSLLSTDSLNHIAGLLATKLRFDVSEIRPPLVETLAAVRPSAPGGTTPSSAGSGLITARNWEGGFPVALIAVGILVFLLAFGGTIYVCVSWKKLQRTKQKRIQPFVIYPTSRGVPYTYDPVIIDPNPKEYETQILQLSVNSTDGSESSPDMKMDYRLRRNHVFPLDNTSYVTHDVGSSSGTKSGHKSPPSSSDSDIATLRISRLAGKGRCEFQPSQFYNQQKPQQPLQAPPLQRDSPIPTANPLYEGRSDEDPFHYTSATNSNVTFRNKLAQLGIPEVSTEL